MVLFENEIWRFGRNLPLATFGSERVKGITIAVDTHNSIILHGNPHFFFSFFVSLLSAD